MEDTVAPEAVVPVAGNEELMAMSEKFRCFFEIVSPAKGLILHLLPKEVQQPKAIERQEQTTFSFDLPVRKPQPIQKVEENNAYAELARHVISR
jgi:cell division protein FtsZ